MNNQPVSQAYIAEYDPKNGDVFFYMLPFYALPDGDFIGDVIVGKAQLIRVHDFDCFESNRCAHEMTELTGDPNHGLKQYLERKLRERMAQRALVGAL